MPNSLTFEFPWPPKSLNPNARVHWRTLAAEKAQYKDECGWRIRYAVGRGANVKQSLTPPVKAQVTFVCDLRRRDPDNTMAMLKPLWDAMVEVGLLVDDSHDKLTILTPQWEVGKPLVRVEMEEAR